MNIKVNFVVASGLLAALLGAHGARAAEFKVQRRIVLPDGKPAAGAKVLVRVTGKERADKRVVADEKGEIFVVFDIAAAPGQKEALASGYLVVDAPGTALSFEKFDNFLRRRDVEPLRLSAGYEIKGRVLDGKGEPLANAQIALALFRDNWSSLLVNVPTENIETPEATTLSRADGSFELRAVDLVEQTFGNGDPPLRPTLIARATRDGALLSGSIEPFARKIGQTYKNEPPENVFRLRPTATVRGRVLDAVSGQPLAGAAIRLRADPPDEVAATIKPTVSGADGRFEIEGVPGFFQLFALGARDNYADAWTRIGEERNRITGDEPQLYENIELQLRPLADVSGRVVDVATGQPPLAPISVSAIYDEGYNDGRIGVGRGAVTTRANADGSFAMKLPVGDNRVRARGAGYWEGGTDNVISLDIKPGDNPGQTIELRREKGFLVHFSAAEAQGKPDYNYDLNYDLHIRGADGKESSTNWSEWWYRALYKPEDTLEIQVTRTVEGFQQEIVPWTKLVPNSPTPANADNWPREIFLPARRTVTIRGQFVNQLSGQPYAGIKVSLAGQPEKLAAKIAPTTTAADGSFVFENVFRLRELTIVGNTGDATDPTAQTRMRLDAPELLAPPRAEDNGHQELQPVVIRVP